MKKALLAIIIILIPLVAHADWLPGKGMTTVQTADGTTVCTGVSTGIVSNGTLACGSGVATITTGGGGSAGNHINSLQRGINMGRMTGAGVIGFAGSTYNLVTTQDAQYFLQKGLTLWRFPIQWEYLQHALNGVLDPIYLANIDAAVAIAKQYGIKLILDLHAFGQRLLYNNGGFTETFSASAIGSTNLQCPFDTSYVPNTGVTLAFSSDECYAGTAANPISPATGYAVSTTFTFVSNDSAGTANGFFIRPMRLAQNGTSYYEFGALLTTGQWYLSKVVSGVTTSLQTGSFAWALSTAYTVKIDINQSDVGFVDVSLNGTPLFTNGTQAVDGTLTNGFVSMLPNTTHTLVSNVTLNVNGDTSLGGITGNFKVGTTQVPISALTNLWSQLAAHYATENTVYGYDVMNEPNSMPIPMTSSNYYDPGPVTVSQLVTNTNFAGGSTTGWTLNTGFTTSSGTGYSGDGNSGGYSIAQSSSAGFNALFTSAITVTPNTNYTVSMYYSAGTFTTAYPEFTVYKSAFNGTILAQNSITAQGSYVRDILSFNSGSGTTSVVIAVKNNGGTGTANYDAFNLTPTSNAITFGSGNPITGSYVVSTVTAIYEAVIPAIRAVDSKSWIMIEPDQFAGMQDFTSIFGTNPLVWWKDQLNMSMLSLHYYFDSNYSGSYVQSYTSTNLTRIPTDVLPAFNWAQLYGVPLFLGEYGVPNGVTSDDLNWQVCMNTFLQIADGYGNNIATAWNSFTPTSSNSLNLTPTNNYTTDRPSMAILLQHLGYGLPYIPSYASSAGINWYNFNGVVPGGAVNWTDVRVFASKYGDHSGINWTAFGV